MTPDQLKASILQLAIQGKLVPQRPEEGTAEDLYKQIQQEKKKLIAAGKIKKEKPLPPIKEDEIPFDIPETWKWVRLGEIAWYLDAGKSPRCLKQPVQGTEWGVITTTAIQEFHFQEWQNKVLPRDFIVNEAIRVQANDILITRAGPMNRTGVACIVDSIRHRLILSDKTIRINLSAAYFYRRFLAYILNAPGIRAQIVERMSGMDRQQVNVSQDKFLTVCIPLPPIDEQRRIVAKIGQTLPLIERYGEAYTALETLDKRFPEDMRKSILQYAIQGKLVPQRPEEGTAEDLYKQIQQEKKRLIAAGKIKKEKPLPPIKEDEIPFDIPETWKWVRLADLVVKEIKRGKSPTYAEKSNVLVFAQKCNVKAGGINMSLARRLDEKKFAAYPESELMQDADIVVNSTGEGTLGRVGIFHSLDNPEGLPIVPDSHVTIIRASSLLNKEWLFYYLKAHQAFFEKAGAGSTKQTELRAETLKALLIALPPWNEQVRLSAMLPEIMQKYV